MRWRPNILPLFTFPDHRQSSWTHSGTLSAVNKKVIWKAMDHRFEGSIFLNNSLRRGPTGPSSLAPATKDKMHRFLIIQLLQKLVGSCPQSHYKLILCKFGQICATDNVPMQLGTILIEFGQISATWNAYIWLVTILCEFGQIIATGNAFIRLESIFCEFGQICARETLWACWKQFYVS